MQYVAGVDAYKSTHAVVFLNAIGKVVRSFTIPASVDAKRWKTPRSFSWRIGPHPIFRHNMAGH